MGGLGLSAKFGTMTFATVSDVKGHDGLQSVPQVKVTYRDSEDGDMKLATVGGKAALSLDKRDHAHILKIAEEKDGISEQEAGTDHATQQKLQLEQHATRVQPKVAGMPKQVDAQVTASESQRQEVANPESRSPQIQLQQETSPDLAADNSERQEPNMVRTGNEEQTAAGGQAGQTKDQEEPLQQQQQQQQQQGSADEQQRAEELLLKNSQADGEVVTEPQESPLYSLTAVDIDGQEKSMREWKGKVLVFVNVASACGYTDSNYKGLVELYKHYKAYGLEILAFPCNQFGGQEPGTLEEIKGFAATYSASFPMFSKVDVNGPNTHPVYKFLKSSMTPPAPNKEFELSWNFNKFLVDAAGRVVKHYQSDWDHSAMFHDVYDLISFGRLRSLEERLQAGAT